MCPCLCSKDLKGYDRYHPAKDTPAYYIASQPRTATFFDQAQADVSYTKGQANEHSLICSRRPCQVSLQLSSCEIAAVLSSIQDLKDPDGTVPFSSLGPALLQMIYSYCGVFTWKASRSHHYNHIPELSRSWGQHRCNTRLGGWTQINIEERNRVFLCAS